MSFCCSSKTAADSSQSFFYNSTSHNCSKREVITLVVLGSLAILMATAALYGYLADSSWLLGAHVLTGTTLFTLALAGSLVLTKCLKSCLAQRASRQADLSEDEIPDNYKHWSRSFTEIFVGVDFTANKAPHAVNEKELLNGWFEENKDPYFVGRDKNDRFFALIKFRDKENRCATLLLGPNASGQYIIDAIRFDEQFDWPAFKDAARFGHPDDVAFFAKLVEEGEWEDKYFLGSRSIGDQDKHDFDKNDPLAGDAYDEEFQQIYS